MSNQLFEEIETVEEVPENFSMEQLAYYLTYSEPDLAEELLDLLLYYQSIGRI